MKILIADDYEDTRLILSTALVSHGYTVVCAENGKKALALTRTEQPDLIISDAMMPEMDGFDFCRAVKTDDALSHIPFVFYTATYIEEQDKALAMAAGASRFVIKPIEMSAFLAMVIEVLDEYYQQEMPQPASPQKSDELLELMHTRVLTRKLDKKIWELKREQRLLAMSELKYKTLFESSGDAIILIEKDQMLDCNQAALVMFGCRSRDAFIGSRLSQWNPATQASGAASKTLMTEHMNKALSQGSDSFEWQYQRPDGLLFPADIRLTVMELDGKPVLQAIVRDISKQKQHEDELRKLSACVEQSGEAVMVTDSEAHIEYINPSFTKLTGYSLNEVAGMQPTMLSDDHQENSDSREMWTALNDGRPWQGKVSDKRKDGSRYPALMTVSPIHDQSDSLERFTHFVCIQSDLTKLDEAEARFHQSQKMEAVGTLVGGIAHDFNNMLAGITGNIYLAKMSHSSDTGLVTKLKEVETLCFRAAEMISQLLTFARKGRVRMQALPLSPFIKETMKLLRTSVPENVVLEQYITPEPLTVFGDGTLIHQVLMNLVTNAVYVVDGVARPVIAVTLEPLHADAAFVSAHPFVKAGEYACLRVQDNGCGIPPEHIEHLYEPFFTTKPVGKGTGLGLAMVFGAVKSHQGYIDVSSEQGEGSSFNIYLPLMQVDGLAQADAPKAIIEGHGEMLLVVDDDAGVRKASVDVLQSIGYRVLEAADGLQAVEQFRTHQSDIALIIMDVVMPVMGGIQAVHRIRRINPAAKVIFATGYDKEEEFKKNPLPEGAKVISKPWKVEAMSTTIRQLLNHPQP